MCGHLILSMSVFGQIRKISSHKNNLWSWEVDQMNVNFWLISPNKHFIQVFDFFLRIFDHYNLNFVEVYNFSKKRGQVNKTLFIWNNFLARFHERSEAPLEKNMPFMIDWWRSWINVICIDFLFQWTSDNLIGQDIISDRRRSILFTFSFIFLRRITLLTFICEYYRMISRLDKLLDVWISDAGWHH